MVGFALRWEKYSKKAVRETLAEWPSMCATFTTAAETGVLKAAVLLCVSHVAKAACEAADPRGCSRLVVKPNRCVEAVTKIPAHGARLVPESLVVKHYTEDQWNAARTKQAVDNEVLVNFAARQHAAGFGRFALSPYTAKDYVSPFWLVRLTEKASEANMTWGSASWSVVGTVEWKSSSPAPPLAPRRRTPPQQQARGKPVRQAPLRRRRRCRRGRFRTSPPKATTWRS